MVGGIVLLVTGVLFAGAITVWAIWAAGKLGPGVWTSVKSLPLIIAFWVFGAAMTIVGIYLMATDHPSPVHGGKHGRAPARVEVRHG